MKPRIHVISILCILILSAGNALAQTNVISTAAGTGTAGSSGDGGPATGAQVNAPFGVTVDGAGNLYIADWLNNRVRKVDTAGVITTVAGTGARDNWGDFGAATAAALNGPDSVAVDSAGNIYIADSANNKIRRVDTSGIITTIAGTGSPGYNGDGDALSHNLSDPSGVAVDNKGNLYIADDGNHRVRKLELASGTLSTVAGTGIGGFSGDGGPATSAQVYNPTHVTVDSAGNLYIADFSNNRIRKVNLSSGIITTVAGSETPNNQGGFSGDGGPATSAEFYHPAGVAVDSSGNLYIADALNKRIRKVDASGIVTTIAGGGTNGDGCNSVTAALTLPMDVALFGNNIYIADYGESRVRMIGTATTAGVPQLTSINPSGGVSGRTYQVTLNGTGFVIGGGGSCSSGTTTVGITGTGVTPSNISITSGAVTLTLTVAPDAPVGPRDVTVTNSSGTSNAVKFTVGLPTPTITSISPSSGTKGTTQTVTLKGTNFVSGSGTTVKISAGGVTASNVNVQSDTSLTATFTIPADATVGTYYVFVSTPQGGDSNSAQFAVSAATPALTSISPASGLRGTSTQVTLTGTNFTAGSTTVAVSPGGITVTGVTVTSNTSLTVTFAVGAAAPLGNYSVLVTTPAGGNSNTVTFGVNPQGPAITYGIPPSLNPTQQVPVQLTLGTALPDSVTGQLTLSFNPNATNNADDPNATFIGAEASARTIGFTFPPNATAAQFSLTNTVLQAGTVGGTIRLTLTDVKVAGQSVTPPNSTFDVTIPLLPPVITSVRILNRTSAGFDVEVTGYSTTRDITQATFQFAAGSGGSLLTAQLQPDVASTFTTYYQSAPSAAVGSAFVYLQPFIAEQGDANVVTSITVTLTNSRGNSDPKTAP